MLPRLATFVEVSEATEFVAADITFVCAKAALPQDSATDEMAAKYILRFLFFISAKVFINFKGLKFSKQHREFFEDSRFTKRHTAQRKDLVQWKINFRQSDSRRPKPVN
jgi:hypothetical protein